MGSDNHWMVSGGSQIQELSVELAVTKAKLVSAEKELAELKIRYEQACADWAKDKIELSKYRERDWKQLHDDHL